MFLNSKFETQSLIFETPFSKVSRIKDQVSMFKDQDVSDQQLTFEPYCTYEMTPVFKPFTIIINVNNICYWSFVWGEIINFVGKLSET